MVALYFTLVCMLWISMVRLPTNYTSHRGNAAMEFNRDTNSWFNLLIDSPI